jgi:serine/threonine-protein kinase
MREWVGRVIDGKYRLVRLLGEGGMGVVYEAQHEVLLRPVAVKFLWPAYAADAGAVRRFHREAQAAGRIGHDNICEVIDLGSEEGGVPYLVMPLLRGRTLADAIDAGGPLAIHRVVDILSQVLDALAAAHDRGIVHRDLKPDNIFLTSIADRQDLVKILDFGIAKILGGAAGGSRSDARLTGTGMVVGTASYMAPEQARGDKDVDHRIDVYAAGAVLYEMATGRRMYDGATYNEVLHKIFIGDFRPVSELRPDVPAEIEAVTMRAVARLRERRYPDARSFRNALWAAHAAVRARTPIRSVAVRSLELPAPPPVRIMAASSAPVRAAPAAAASPSPPPEESAAWVEPAAAPRASVASSDPVRAASAAAASPSPPREESAVRVESQPPKPPVLPDAEMPAIRLTAPVEPAERVRLRGVADRSPARGDGARAPRPDAVWSADATMPIAAAVVRFVDAREGGGREDVVEPPCTPPGGPPAETARWLAPPRADDVSAAWAAGDSEDEETPRCERPAASLPPHDASAAWIVEPPVDAASHRPRPPSTVTAGPSTLVLDRRSRGARTATRFAAAALAVLATVAVVWLVRDHPAGRPDGGEPDGGAPVVALAGSPRIVPVHDGSRSPPTAAEPTGGSASSDAPFVDATVPGWVSPADPPVAPDDARGSAPPDAAPETTAANGSHVRLMLPGAPAGAKVSVDGRDETLRDGGVDAVRADRQVPILVEADGYVPFRGWVVPNQDRRVQVTMRAAATGASGTGVRTVRDAGVRGAGASAAADAGGRAAAPSAATDAGGRAGEAGVSGVADAGHTTIGTATPSDGGSAVRRSYPGEAEPPGTGGRDAGTAAGAAGDGSSGATLRRDYGASGAPPPARTPDGGSGLRRSYDGG